MSRLLLLFICILYSALCYAQNEKFTVQYKNDNLVIEHKVNAGETIFSIARKYHVPPSALTDINSVSYTTTLSAGDAILVPLAVYNHINEAPGYMNDVRPLYYRVEGHESMSRVVKKTGVPERKIEKWNNLTDNTLRNGQELMIGWVLYDATPIKQTIKEPEQISRTRGDWSTRAVGGHIEEKEMPQRTLDNLRPDTVVVTKQADTAKKSPEEELYLSQTLQEQRVITEKGPAVFFPATNNTVKAYYAFHSGLRRGAIIKVFNPGTGRSVFVKVIGPIPSTAQYYNSVIGISSAAKRELGVKENKMFCEISYGVL